MAKEPDLIVRCVNAHDRCFGGSGGPCPYCEPVVPLRDRQGQFASSDAMLATREKPND